MAKNEWEKGEMSATGDVLMADSCNFQFAGGMAGVNSWVISYPADVVKTRIQAQHMDKPALYKNFFHGLECFKKERIKIILTNFRYSFSLI